MELPYLLRTEIEKLTSGYRLDELIAVSESITDKYKKESGCGRRLLTNDLEAIVYSIVRMPATYGAIHTALEYTTDFFNERITSVLDVGAGTGAAAWAISEMIEDDLNFTCVERESAMIKIGKKLSSCNTRLNNINWVEQDYTTDMVERTYDLVIASYTFNELTANNRINVINHLWNITNKILLIVEPGTLPAFSQLTEARNLLLSKGGHIVAPCPNNDRCPMVNNDWCHFTCRIPRSKLHKMVKKAEVPYEDEKFSFLAVSKLSTQQAHARITRHPIIEPGRITLQLCTNSMIETRLITKKNGPLFKEARKKNCGDTW